MGNIVQGRVVALDSSGSVLWNDGGSLLGVVGMHDVAVVHAGNGILVCPLAEEQRVRELVREAARQDGEFV